MNVLDRIKDSFKYLDKNGLKRVLTLVKDMHWTGTHAEYEAQKDSIPANTILHFTDDYDDNLGMPIKDVSSSAGVTTGTFKEFVEAMLADIAMQTWENGSYAGKFQSTHAGGGDFGSWLGAYLCTKSHSSAYGTTVVGTANNKPFSAMWCGSTDGWLVIFGSQEVVLWSGTATKGGIINLDDKHISEYSLLQALIGGTWCTLVSGKLDTGRHKFTAVYSGRDYAAGGTYQQYYILDILSDHTVATCGWFDIGSKDTQNARLAGQQALTLAGSGGTWVDPAWKTLADVETNVNVTQIRGYKFVRMS